MDKLWRNMKDSIKGFFIFFFKSIIFSIIVLLVLYALISYSCKANEEDFKSKLYESEYFIYHYNKDKNYLQILGLTDLGKEQEYLIIPETIDGKKVVEVGCNYGWKPALVKEKFGEGHEQFHSDKLKRIYVNADVKIIDQSFAGNLIHAPLLEGFMYIYISENNYLGIHDNAYTTSFNGGYRSANVSYFYNYENAINEGYYWIDNYNYGEKIEFIPPEPTREGYTFAGWYKESECINKWNFETDTLPQAQYDENDRKIYQETKLYAKWINKGD